MGKKDDINRFKEISRRFKLRIFVLYTYKLTKQAKSKRVRFVYVLKGRGREHGLVEEFKGKWLAPGCFLIPISHDKEMQEIFAHWNIRYRRRLLLMR